MPMGMALWRADIKDSRKGSKKAAVLGMSGRERRGLEGCK